MNASHDPILNSYRYGTCVTFRPMKLWKSASRGFLLVKVVL